MSERKDKIKKILGKIKNEFELGYQYLYNKNKQILIGQNLIDLKNSLKTNVKSPSKNINVSIIDFGILEKNYNTKNPVLIINCTPAIITPSLNLKIMDNEYGLTFTFTTDELLEFGYKKSYLNKMINSIKNKMIKSNTMEVSITKLLELFD